MVSCQGSRQKGGFDMLEEEVLALLRGHGEGHLSGEAMSRTLAVSRAAV